MGMKQIWDGKNLPPVGCEVLIHLASVNKWVARTVQGYEIWPSVYENDTAHHRINIKFEDNVRLLCDVRPLDWREPD